MVRICAPFNKCFRKTKKISITPVPKSEPSTLTKTKPSENADASVSEIINTGQHENIIVSGIDSSQDVKDFNFEKFEKDIRSYKRIENALHKNDFIKNLLDPEKLKTVIEAMVLQECAAGSFIINEGETGSHLYVSDSGTFEVIKAGKVVKVFGAGEAFGELAVLYKAKRFASIRAKTNARIWSIERKSFQAIIVRTGKQEQENNVRFLSSVPLLRDIPTANLYKIADFLQRKYFVTDTPIVKQGETGDKFYIIRGGTVVVTQRSADGETEKVVAELGRGDYFGEQALLRQDKRMATVTAQAPGVECLTLSRKPFKEYLGDIEELKTTKYPTPSGTNVRMSGPAEYDHIKLEDLNIVGTMGVGAFGRVDLVEYALAKDTTFALKRLKKVELVKLEHQEHAYDEKNNLLKCNSPFICRLYKTFKDTRYLYLMMEPLLGGDVWTILQKKKFFDEKTARFMVACVVEAFEHMHGLDIVYRDLKPENLMLDSKGYVKLVDFGYAKYLATNIKTYTFAGTPEYVAPEIILGTGHDRAADYWTLGVLTHELLAGKPPFRGANPVRTYNLILRGVDAAALSTRATSVAQALVRKLCRPLPSERLGYLKNGIKDIKNHKWFSGFDWQKLRERKMPAPLIRPVKHCRDLTNFEVSPSDKIVKTPPEETSGWDEDF